MNEHNSEYAFDNKYCMELDSENGGFAWTFQLYLGERYYNKAVGFYNRRDSLKGIALGDLTSLM